MQRKTLGIVSSYNTMCGNATYTHVLKQEFAKHCDVRIITVNHRLLSNTHPMAASAVEAHLQQICNEIAACDYVNIQFEPGLYGARPKQIAANVCRLIAAVKHQLVFTVHRLHVPPDSQLHVAMLKGLMGGLRGVLLAAKEWQSRNRGYAMTMRIVGALQEKLKLDSRSVTVITHTARDQENMNLLYGLKSTIDFPVTFLSREQIVAHVSERAQIRQEVMAEYGLDPAHKHIGIFGFLSENKGHHVALDALRFLSDDYRLAIFGGQHPMSIKEYDLGAMSVAPKLFAANNNSYISSLVDAAQQLVSRVVQLATKDEEAAPSDSLAQHPSEHRVRFLGSVDDPAFIRAIVAMDYVFVPYFETGQGGSGNASLVLELQSKAIFSRNLAFLELGRYYQSCYKFADIGNALEMAQNVFFWNEDFTANQQRYTALYNIENNVLVHLAAFEGGAEAGRACKQKVIQG
jgi:glycosyltransferase involved in cell wall biosynthesis